MPLSGSLQAILFPKVSFLKKAYVLVTLPLPVFVVFSLVLPPLVVAWTVVTTIPVIKHPFSGRNPVNSPVHTDLDCGLPYVGRRDRAHSHHIFSHCTNPFFLVGISPPYGTVHRPVRDCNMVQ